MNCFNKKDKQQGATFVELIFVIPLFFFLVGGIFEMSYIYRTKSTLNIATFEAAREGAVTNVSKDSMRQSLATGMAPIFVKSKTSAAAIGQAWIEAQAFEKALSQIATGSLDSINIISPNQSVFARFKKEVAYYDEDDKKVKKVTAIPNDNLMFRETSLENVNINGESVQINIQDANLLKIKTFWCHRLKIPALRDLVDRTILNSSLFTQTNEQTACNLFGKTGVNQGVYVALTAQAITRIQSPIYSDDLE